MPGFSIDSVTITSAFSGSLKSASPTETCGPTMSRPSGRSLYAIFAKHAFEHVYTSAPRRAQSSTSAGSFSFLR